MTKIVQSTSPGQRYVLPSEVLTQERRGWGWVGKVCLRCMGKFKLSKFGFSYDLSIVSAEKVKLTALESYSLHSYFKIPFFFF